MADSSSGLINDALDFASRAVHFDKNGQLEVSAYYYREAGLILQTAAKSTQGNVDSLLTRAKEYRERADALDAKREVSGQETGSDKSQQQLDLERAYFLLTQGLDEDEDGNVDEAVELYSEAVELCLQTKNATSDAELQKNLAHVIVEALQRAESLKGIRPNSPTSPHAASPMAPTNAVPVATSGPVSRNKPASRGQASHLQMHRGHSVHLQVSGNESYSDEEKRVLGLTSLINGREYMPFMSVDLKERFAYPIPFTDRDGQLQLSPKQKKSFARWARPEDFMSSPKMVEVVDYFSIKQTVISDCSFVASVAISALYEKIFKKRLITSVIYPKNRNGDPVYNPCGKYMVKLHLNGIPRKVVIDDNLPLGSHGELLCSYSTNKNELWISLLEKAYMKVMGGYDFPGSNSNIDLHALTGWIPERVSIRPDDHEFNKDAVFKKMLDRFHKGDVLVTIATGEMSDLEAERAGLVPTHAYAMLDIKEVQGIRLFLLKNPWSHLRWRGNYSELDQTHWTPEMKQLLNFDPKSAKMFDNGVFWIDYDSVCRFFDVFYMNWNPSLFSHTYCIHQSWKAGCGPVKDMYIIADNPQYCLEVQASRPSVVWILLTRHITEIEDFKQNKEYIAVLVYKKDGKKVYYPYDPPPYIDGVRINSPHYLCKIQVDKAGTFRYTLVVSQYEKMNTINYTLRVYATCQHSLRKIGNPFKHKKEVTDGHWKGRFAGGCSNHPNTYPYNPRYQITLESSSNDNHLLVDLKGPKQYQVGFDIICVVASDKSSPGYFSKKTSGPYRSGFVVMALENVPAGTYDIVPSTFMPGQEGPFFLSLESSCPFKMGRIQ